MHLIEAGLICPRYNHIKTPNKIAQNGSQRLLWYPLAGSGMSHGVLWLCSGMSHCYPHGVLWLALAGSGCALVCLIVGYALMMSCVKIDHALTLHFGYCLFMLI